MNFSRQREIISLSNSIPLFPIALVPFFLILLIAHHLSVPKFLHERSYAKKAKAPETLPGHGAFAFDVCIIYHCVIPVKYMLVIKP